MGNVFTTQDKKLSIDINSNDYIGGRKGMNMKRIYHRIILVRHGETESNNKLMNNKSIKDEKTLNTFLTETGLQQADDVYNYLNNTLNFKPDKVIYSPLSRAYNTALPFVSTNTLKSSIEWTEYNPKRTEYIEYDKDEDENDDDDESDYGSTWTYNKETSNEFKNRILKEFKILTEQGDIENRKQTLIFTHSQVISTILSYGLTNLDSNITESGIEQENDEYLKTFFHLSNCSITCIDIDEDRQCHVQTVNYTKHLDICTGQHSPFI